MIHPLPKRWCTAICALFLLLPVCGLAATTRTLLSQKEADLSPTDIIPARMHDAGMPEAFEHYNNVLCASDGKVYFILATKQPDLAAQMFQYDPKSGAVRRLADMDDVVGQKGAKAFPQGKCHVGFFEHKGVLYTALTSGFVANPAETAKIPGTEGFGPYPGGHFISYDLSTGKFEDLGKAPEGEGIISMVMDKARKRLYGLTSPGGRFVSYDFASKWFRVIDNDFKSECRTLAVDPTNGDVYWTTKGAEVVVYRYAGDKVEKVEGCDLRDPAFKAKPNLWRSVFWYPKEKAFIGIAGECVLFRFDPSARKVWPMESIAVRLAREKGSEGFTGRCFSPNLGFCLGPDGKTIYYLATGPALDLANGPRLDRTVNFVTYHIPSATYTDHGKLRLDDGRYPLYAQSIDVAPDGTIYTVAWIGVADDSPRAAAVREAMKRRPGEKEEPLYEINLVSFADPTKK